MTDEEFKKLKEEEKDQLRQLRALKRAVHLLERQQSVTHALEEMTTRSREALEANERLIEEIAREAAHGEARLDIALESLGEADTEDPTAEAARRARALVETMRAESQPATESTSTRTAPPTAESDRKAQQKDAPAPLPEKTLGRMR